MNLRYIQLIAVYILLSGCTGNSVPGNVDKEISLLINRAEDNKLPLLKRRVYAKQADSLAKFSSIVESKLNVQRTVAGLDLMLGALDSAKMGFRKMADIANQILDFENLGIAYNNLGIICDKNSEYDSALFYYDKAILNFAKNNNQLQIGRCLVNVGILQLNQDNFEDAFQTSEKAAKILDTLKAKDELASVYITLGIILKKQTAYGNAMSYFDRAQQILQDEKDTAGIATVLTNKGDVYRKEKQYSEALKFYKRSLAMKMALGLHQYAGNVLDNLAEMFLLCNNIDSAKKYCEEALSVWITNNDRESIFTTSNRMARVFLEAKDFGNAIHLATQIRTQFPSKGFLEQKLENCSILFNAYVKRKQSDSAIKYANMVIALKDSVFNFNMAENVARMDAKFRNNEMRRELLFSQQVQAVQLAQIHTQQNFLILLAVSSLLLSTLLILLFFSYRNIKKAKRQIEILMRELNHRVKNNLQIISDMLYLQKGIAKDSDQTTMIQASLNRVDSMSIIHSLLYHENTLGTISMEGFIKILVTNLSRTYGSKSKAFQISLHVNDVSLSIDKAIPIGLIINELITNIFKYGKLPQKQVALKISFDKNDNKYHLEITDTCGEWNINDARRKKSGLGLFLVETLAKQLNGTLSMTSSASGSGYFLEL